MNIVSYVDKGKDIIQLAVEEIKDNHPSLSQTKLYRKIFLSIKLFVMTQRINGINVKSLGDNVFECRISIPDTQDLIRIIFAWQKDTLILLTGYLIKPKMYGDRGVIIMIQDSYKKEIEECKRIFADFESQRNTDHYQLVNEI